MWDRHRRDWDPYRVQALPLLQKVKAGAEFQVTIVATATGDKPETFSISLAGRGPVPDQAWTMEAMPGKPKSQAVKLKLRRQRGQRRCSATPRSSARE